MKENQRMEYNFANDNDPPGHGRIYAQARQNPSRSWPANSRTDGLVSVSDFSPVKPRVEIKLRQKNNFGRRNASSGKQVIAGSEPASYKKSSMNSSRKNPLLHLGLGVLAMAILASLAIIAITPFSSGLIGIFGALITVISASGAIAARKIRAKIIHSVLLSAMSIGAAMAIWAIVSNINMENAAEIFIIILAASSILMARLLQSPYFLAMSALLMIVWAGLSLPLGHMSALAWLFPALWSVHFYLAINANLRRAVVLSAAAGFMWIGMIVLNMG